jgi:hypothetical protein
VALAVALLAGGIALASKTGSPELELPYGSVGQGGYVVVALANVLTFTVVGAFVASRHPRNPIGWIFCTLGLVTGLDALTHGYTEFWLVSGWGSRSFGETVAWFGTWAWIFQTVALTFLLLLFPNGRLPSPRWWPAAWCAGLGIGASVVSYALDAGTLADFPQVVNPYGVDSPLVRTVGIAGLLLIVGSMVASAISVIIRARHSGEVERQQIKWLAYGGVVTVGTSLVAGAISVWSVTVSIAVTNLALLALPIFTGIAIVRSRLYDIDFLINRTLVYGCLTATLIALYFGGIVVLQWVFVFLTGQQSTLAVVASTLLIAALFTPLRRRIQRFIDRRFYRSKYDARKTLEGFSVKLREETDLEALNDELVGVVRETMQPAHVSLWLRPDTASKGKALAESPRRSPV